MIQWYNSLDSTNSEALRHLWEIPSGTVIAAREQTAGRGQRGNSWLSAPGDNLTFSVVLKFGQGCCGSLPAADAHWLNYLASLAVARFLQGRGAGCSIKWPNDIYVGRRKICGILVETRLHADSLEAAVIGIGININQKEFPSLANATSLFNCTGKKYDTEECLKDFVGIFESLLPSLFDAGRRTALFSAYSALLFQKGVSAGYHDYLREEQFTGVIEGVAPDGRLSILDSASVRRLYRFKEVGYIL
ncbi:MAG: biotin--[acetyl-CoA-carboxylase] ligase [Bacteroidales bacterium]|nr:biotin--[acetyl-CoA-carboxylase] ligase [Bacteroidales bacterium]